MTDEDTSVQGGLPAYEWITVALTVQDAAGGPERRADLLHRNRRLARMGSPGQCADGAFWVDSQLP